MQDCEYHDLVHERFAVSMRQQDKEHKDIKTPRVIRNQEKTVRLYLVVSVSCLLQMNCKAGKVVENANIQTDQRSEGCG